MKDTTSVEVRKYYAANWWSVSGVAAKMKRIIAKGVPNLKDWRFITLTIDPALFDSELDAYLAGKEKMRRFLYNLRQELGVDAKWAWKLEFQKNGMPHWHLYFEFKRPVNLEVINKLWGLGRTNVKRCDEKSIHYAFKYAFKPVMKKDDHYKEFEQYESDETAIPLPDWFLDYYKANRPGQKAESFSRVRFWQTARGFYTGKSPEPTEVKEVFSCILPRTMRSVAKEGVSKVQILARSVNGDYGKSAVVVLTCTAAALFSDAGCLVVRGQAAPAQHNQGYLVPSDFLKNKVKQTNLIKLCQIQQLNQQSIRGQIRKIYYHQMQGLS